MFIKFGEFLFEEGVKSSNIPIELKQDLSKRNTIY